MYIIYSYKALVTALPAAIIVLAFPDMNILVEQPEIRLLILGMLFILFDMAVRLTYVDEGSKWFSGAAGGTLFYIPVWTLGAFISMGAAYMIAGFLYFMLASLAILAVFAGFLEKKRRRRIQVKAVLKSIAESDPYRREASPARSHNLPSPAISRTGGAPSSGSVEHILKPGRESTPQVPRQETTPAPRSGEGPAMARIDPEELMPQSAGTQDRKVKKVIRKARMNAATGKDRPITNASCSNCGQKINITSAQRPQYVTCPGCDKMYILKN